MPQLRAPDGSIVTVPDEQAGQLVAGGYEPVTLGEAGAVTGERAREDSGVLAPAGALASSFLSGASLGLSDLAFKHLLNRESYERLATDREQHPIISGAGQLAGAAVGGPTPAGALSRATGALAEGGGVAAKLAASGVEGSVFNAGAYLSDSALQDRELSAEGLRASLGPGFEFGAAGGVAALGIEKGTIAARRMFSRLADGTDRVANEAEQAWRAKYQETIEAHDAAADVARAKLAEARLGRQQAQVAQQRAAADVADARAGVRAPAPAAEAPAVASGEVPTGAPPAPTPSEPPAHPDVEIAGLLRDRAMAAAQPSDLAAWDAQHGPRLQSLMQARQVAGGIPPGLAEVAAKLPETAAQRSAALSEAAEAEIAAALHEHDAAKADLESLLQRLEVPDVGQPGGTLGRPAVPVGEFGAPGAGGIKRGAELEPRPPTAVEAATGDVTAVGKRRPAVEPAPSAAPIRIEVHEVGRTEQMRATMPDGTTRDLGKNGADAFLAEQMPPGFRPAKVETHRSFAIEHGLPATAADVAKLDENAIYIAKPSEVAERDVWGDPLKDRNLADVAERWKRGEKLPPIDAYVTPEGRIYIEDGNHRLARAAQDGDRPVAIRFKDGTGYRPHGEAHEIGGRIRGDLPTGGRAARPAGIPDHATIKAHEVKADAPLEATVPAREIAARGYYEPPVRGGGTLEQADPVRMAKARQAIAEGQREPIDLNVTPGGKITVSGGRHRLQAAIEADAPIRVRWSTGSAEPAADDVLRHGPRAPASDTLTGQLRSTAAKVNEGETIGRIGAESPARAEYVTARAAKQQAAAEHFRGEVLGRREARARAVAQGETPNPFHEPVPTGAELDQFFRDLNAPKTRDAYVAANIQRAMREEGSHAAALAKVEREWAATSGHPLSVRQLETVHDAALERAATAADPAERAAAQAEASAISEQLTAVGKRPGAVEDIAAAAPVVTRYERAAAKLTEALGDEAPPAAKEAAQAFRAAEDAAERKTVDRATRAIDDHVTTSAADYNAKRKAAGLPDALAKPSRPGTGPEVTAAKTAKARADADLARARAAETEAKMGADAAKRRAAETRVTAEAARPVPPEPPPPSKLGSVLTAVAAAGELGVPGIPHPHDIPVIGPLLSLWTKYRIAKAMVGRFAGRVSATGDARAAALAARAKDKIAAAVDRTLGLAAEVAPKLRQPVVIATTVLGHRLIDDGEPDAPKGASAQELAAVRIREISAAATRPDLVTAMVRQKLGTVTDPDLIKSAEIVLQQQFQSLAQVMPKLPPDNPYSKTRFTPSAAAAADLAQRIGVMHAPETAFDNPTPAKADALANFYPRLFQFAQQRLADRAADLENPMSYRQQLQATLIFRVPVASAMEPGRLAVLQSAHVAIKADLAPQPSAPPTASVAQPTNLNQMYQTSADRRAARSQ